MASSSSSLPPTMNAVRVDATGGVDVLQYVTDQPVPQLQEGQVLVRNEFIGINFIDTYFRTGLYPAKLPFVPGREAAGTVAAVHPSVGSSVKPGDRVAYMSNNYAYAAYTAVPAASAVAVPDGVSTEVAAASLIQGLTAWTFIHEAGEVRPGQWVLVHAAAGGVGLLLCQMLKIVGAKVIGMAGSEDKCALARANGADVAVNSREDGLVAKVMDVTGGKGVDVIFDGVGKATFDMDLEMVARKGSVLAYGNASGVVPPLDLLRLGPRNVKVMRPVVTGYVAERHELEKYTGELFELIGSGKVKVKLHQTYALKDVAQAHTDLESRKTVGKLLIKVD